MGMDLNADHLASAETDRFRNLIDLGRFDCAVYGKTDEQATLIIGDAAARIAGRAKLAGKPVVIEKLDFQKKKAGNYSDRQKIRKSSHGSYPHSWISDNGLDTPGAVEAGHFQRNQANYA
jgi:hypothetical protein